MLNTMYGHKLVPYANHMDHLTLEYLTTQFHYQVICIYRSDAARFGQPLLWPSASWPTPWPNTDSISALIRDLNIIVDKRSPEIGHVSQCILTPQTSLVAKNLWSKIFIVIFLNLLLKHLEKLLLKIENYV